MADEHGGLTEEELAALEEHLRSLKVVDVLTQTVVTVSTIGYRRMSGDDGDLAQARLAIDALRALVPVLAEVVEPDAARELNGMVAGMQLAFAKAASEAKEVEESPGPDAGS